MGRRIVMVLLALGAIFGFARGIHRLSGGHGWRHHGRECAGEQSRQSPPVRHPRGESR